MSKITGGTLTLAFSVLVRPRRNSHIVLVFDYANTLLLIILLPINFITHQRFLLLNNCHCGVYLKVVFYFYHFYVFYVHHWNSTVRQNLARIFLNVYAVRAPGQGTSLPSVLLGGQCWSDKLCLAV